MSNFAPLIATPLGPFKVQTCTPSGEKVQIRMHPCINVCTFGRSFVYSKRHRRMTDYILSHFASLHATPAERLTLQVSTPSGETAHCKSATLCQYLHPNAVVTPLRKAASYEQRETNLGSSP